MKTLLTLRTLVIWVLFSAVSGFAEEKQKPVKVFILAGQSNMEGQGFTAADPTRNEGKGSLEYFVKSDAGAKRLVGKDGKWAVRDDVWISYLDRKGPLTVGFGARPDRIGPELGFGWVMGDAFDEPVVLIKCAWGGKSLAVDFRPPGAGKIPYSLGARNDRAIENDLAMVGKYYRETLGLTRDALAGLDELFPALKSRGHEVAGFVWHQGWNDRINDQFNAEYASNFAHFIRDIRRELELPDLPFVIAETGMAGPEEKHPRALSLMKAQASVAEMPEFKGNVAFVGTKSFWRAKEASPNGQSYHWNCNAETYYRMGVAMGDAMKQMSPPKAEVSRPRLQIINGSSQPIDILWLKTDAEREPNGSVAAGKDTVMTTTLGHRFVVVGREDHSEATVTSVVPVQGFRFDPAGEDGVPAFYTQKISAGGFPIVASANVNPYALKEAAFLANMMFAKRPDVRDAMIRSGARMSIIAWNEFTTDLPEFAHLKPKDFWDARARGTGGSATDPYCTSAEENLLGYPGDPYSTESIFIHEFAHSIHLRGMANVDPSFDDRVAAAYDAAMQAGLWKGKYASVNHHEYFAEGVQSWFDNNREPDHDHNHVNTRAELLAYDAGLAALCREVFGDTELKYTKPATRLTAHMAGYDPLTAPTFVWPERLAKAKADIRAKAQARDQAANGVDKGDNGDTRDIAGWTLHINKVLLTGENQPMTTRALDLLKVQLDEIIRVLPAAAVVELQKVPLYFSPKYPNAGARAEYHPGAGWLRDNGRDPGMVQGVEFTNIPDFEAETRRMPNFALHELAHAYHDRYLPEGFGNAEIKAAYEKARAGGRYDRVERQDSEGRKRMDRAYALTNPQEYFAECTEAYFSRNDFYPYNREELMQHDADVAVLLEQLWDLPSK